MHYITSNFNLLHSNNKWEILKKKHCCIDMMFNNFFLNLCNEEFLENYSSFHILINFSLKNAKEITKKLKSLNKVYKKNQSKIFFVYFFTKKEKKITAKLNKLSSLLEKNNNVFLKKFLNLKNNFFNYRNEVVLKFPYDISAINFFSFEIKKNIKLTHSKTFKLIILDCDNTLWGGVLDEEKIENLKYFKSNYFKFQKKLLELKKKGFLLSICSKNDEKNVWKVFKKKKMILQKKDFLFPKINWAEKTNNIIEIVSKLNLRYEDVVFIDDNPLELAKVKKNIKKINIFSSEDTDLLIKNIDKTDRFKKLIVLKEDKIKHSQYKLQSKFSELLDKKGSLKNSLSDLKQKVKFINCGNNNIARVEQLFNKTNQFHMTLNRYKSHDIKKLINNNSSEIKLFQLKDKFGDHGIIGLYVLTKESKKILISDFIISCRVLYRNVEEYVLKKIINKYKNNKIEILYIRGKTNTDLIPSFLKRNSINLLKKNKQNEFYKIKLTKQINESSKYFT